MEVVINTQFQISGEIIVELNVVVFFVLSNLVEYLDALLLKVFPDDLENFVLLKCLTRDVKRKIIDVHTLLEKSKALWNKLCDRF